MRSKKQKTINTVLKVDMDDMKFSNQKTIVLSTKGVTACIAFAVYGQYWHDDNPISFCGLYHWSGFEADVHNTNSAISDVLDNFFSSMANELDSDDGALIEINKLAFIGGERRQYDNKGQLLLSGTEKEVESLIEAVKSYDFGEVDIDIDENAIEHYHFLTSDEQSLTIEVSSKEIKFEIKIPDDIEEKYGSQEAYKPSS